MARKRNEANMKAEIAKLAKSKSLPILTLDSRWHLLFPEERKTSAIKKLEKKLNDMLKRQGKIVQDAKELKKLKQKLMSDIVNNMQESQGTQGEALRVKKLDSSQKYIKEINDKLQLFNDELEQMPQEISKLNEQLMVESLEICYANMHKNKVQIVEMDEWINETRNRLKETLVRKQEMEQVNAEIYSYMHDILGAKAIEIFDADHKNF